MNVQRRVQEKIVHELSCNVNWISEQNLLLFSWIFFVINCILLPLTYTLTRSHGFNFVTSLLIWRNNILFSSYYSRFYLTKLLKKLRSVYEVKEKILLWLINLMLYKLITIIYYILKIVYDILNNSPFLCKIILSYYNSIKSKV